MARGDPLDGQVLLLSAAKASVAPEDLPTLVDRVQVDLAPRLDEYRRAYEAVSESPDRAVFLVPPDHWEGVGDRLGLTTRERRAVRRAHEEQLRRLGTRLDRRDEFENALDIRSAVVIGIEPEETETEGEDEDEDGRAAEPAADRGSDGGVDPDGE